MITDRSITKYPTTIKPTEEFCLDGYFPIPDAYKFNSSLPADIEVKNKTVLFDKWNIFATQICFKPVTLLPESKPYTMNISYLDLLDLGIFQKKIQITTETYPEVRDIGFEEEINSNQVLKYYITYANDLLEYVLLSGENSVTCTNENASVLCDISSLGLEHGKTYELSLVEKYQGSTVKQLSFLDVNIRTNVIVHSSSLANNAVIQDLAIPLINITLNKEIENSAQISLADSSGTPVKFENSIIGNVIAISPKENFKQNTTYSLKINSLTGLDGSQMENEYFLTFSIGDGPRISGTNIGNGFSTTNNIVFTFNQNIQNPQSVKNFIKIDSATNYSYTISKNQITINPDSSLNLCQKYTITVGKGIVGSTGLISSSGSSYSLKTTCKRTVSIGTSVEGRSIYAYYFGTGSQKIIFFGAIHGSEANTRTLMNRWVTELENNSDRIPTNKTIIVVPTVNPDGIANRSRFNANGVDLNRNFDTPSWATGTYLQTDFYPRGGGSAPFSEPESVDIRDLLYREDPYLTLTYHSAAGYVIPTNSSYAISSASTYSQLTGYQYVSPGDEGSFTYDITGTFEEWAQGRGYNALVIELSNAYYDQFLQNTKAMWRMVEQ